MTPTDLARLNQRLDRLDRIVLNLAQAYATGDVPQPLAEQDKNWVRAMLSNGKEHRDYERERTERT